MISSAGILGMVLGGLLVLPLAGCGAEQNGSATAERIEQYRGVVDRLGAAEFKQRELAVQAIVNAGEPEALVALLRFADPVDLEVRRRILRILELIMRQSTFEQVSGFMNAADDELADQSTTRQVAWRQLLQRLEAGVAQRILLLGGKVGREQLPDGTERTRVTVYKWQDRTLGDYLKVYRRLHLVLSGPAITDHSLEQIADLRNLEVLDARFTQVTDRGIHNLRKLTGLRKLYLSRTSISDRSMSDLRSLARLEHLFLSDTQLTDAAVAELSRMTHLKRLSIRGTRISGRKYDELQAALPDCQVNY